jgi:isopentenyl-diphosphate Delta-isomerase
MNEEVILVNSHDHVLGIMNKLEAHQLGKLHRAFSIFIFNTSGAILLQQRSLHKYHSGGKWSNACCSHPRPHERTLDAAHRRLKEEIGLCCELTYAFNFMYKATLDDLIEHEFDHVFFGVTDQIPTLNLVEVEAYKFMDMEDLSIDLQGNPNDYTIWLKLCYDQIFTHYAKHILV